MRKTSGKSQLTDIVQNNINKSLMKTMKFNKNKKNLRNSAKRSLKRYDDKLQYSILQQKKKTLSKT